MIAGTLFSAVGAVQQGAAAANAARHNAAVADRDAYVAAQNRELTLRQARIDVEDKKRENRRTMARIATQYGASGLELAGSPLDVLADTSTELALDTRRIGYEGKVRGRESALQVLGLQEDASMSRVSARNSKRGGFLAGAGALLSGVGAGVDAYNRLS